MTDQIVARCTMCSSEFSAAQLDGAKACPACQTESVPCDPKEDVSLKINWHELRILGMWAENWAVACQTQNPEMKILVDRIAGRLEAQFPEKPPVTLSRELRALRKEYPNMETTVDLSPRVMTIDGGKEPIQ